LFKSSQTFHQTPYERELENAARVQFELEKLKSLDSVTQEQRWPTCKRERPKKSSPNWKINLVAHHLLRQNLEARCCAPIQMTEGKK
jgi:hypothetical protein